MMRKIGILLLVLLPAITQGQFCDSFELNIEDELDLGCVNNTVTVLRDQMGREYLYTANTQNGFKVIDISDPENMAVEVSLGSEHFGDLAVNRITQQGEYLYLALGSMFGDHSQLSGLAIIDVSSPLAPEVTDMWSSDENGGAAHVGVRGHLAYICGLSNGIIVLNISDPENISFVSQYIPPTGWPEGTDPNHFKARHIVFDGDLGYVTYGGGGLRVLDLSNPSELVEVARYSNPAMDGATRAYNNSVLKDNLLYIAVDYAGLEILDISDLDDITLHGWWNPNELPMASPPATSAVWFSSHWHTNEIELIDECGIIFMSCGRTEIVGVDISNPAAPELCGSFGDPGDNLSSYGMTRYEDHLYVGMICTFGVPFPGNWAGVKSLIYDSDCPLGISEPQLIEQLHVYPNPTTGLITIEGIDIEMIQLYSLQGQKVMSQTNPNSGTTSLKINTLPEGVYLMKIIDKNGLEHTEKLHLTQK